ncbi:MAG: hypothetical protein RR382_00605 [Tannerellaceae bacterium]
MKSTNNIPSREHLLDWLSAIVFNVPGQDRLKKLMESGAIFNEELEAIADELATASKEEAVQRYVATVSETTGMRELELHLFVVTKPNDSDTEPYKVVMYAFVEDWEYEKDEVYGALARASVHNGEYIKLAGSLI